MTSDAPFLSLTHPPIPLPPLRNWSSTYNHTPSLLFRPVSNQEVALIYRQAGKEGRKVRVVGEHLSPGPGWHAEWLISTQHFHQIHLDTTSRLARLGAGVKMSEANPLLASHGLAFPTIGSIADISSGANFVGPDHGSSAEWGINPTYANRITLVTPLGEIKKLQRGDDLFRAAGAGLGAVGCVTEVEWELVEAFGLEVTMERIKLGEYLEDGSGKKLYDLAKSEEYVKIWHFPHTLPFPLSHSDTILWRARRVPLPPPSPPPSLSDKLYKALANLLHGFCILVTLYLFPRLQGYVNGVQYWLAAWRLPRRETKRGYEAMEMDCGYSQLVNEWAVPFPSPSSPLPTTSSSPYTCPAISLLTSLLTYLSSPAGLSLGMHAPIEIRFSKTQGVGEGFYLSTAAALVGRRKGEGNEGEGDLVMHVEPIIYRPLSLPTPSRFYTFNTHLESLLRHPSISARPHWCKAHFPTSPAELARMFGREEVESFHRVRREADPRGTAWTAWMGERCPDDSEERGGKGSTTRESEREGKRSGRWEDVMGQRWRWR